MRRKKIMIIVNIGLETPIHSTWNIKVDNYIKLVMVI